MFDARNSTFSLSFPLDNCVMVIQSSLIVSINHTQLWETGEKDRPLTKRLKFYLVVRKVFYKMNEYGQKVDHK